MNFGEGMSLEDLKRRKEEVADLRADLIILGVLAVIFVGCLIYAHFVH